MINEKIKQCEEILKDLDIKINIKDIKLAYIPLNKKTTRGDDIYVVNADTKIELSRFGKKVEFDYILNIVDMLKNTDLDGYDKLIYKIDGLFYKKKHLSSDYELIDYIDKDDLVIPNDLKCWIFSYTLSDYLWYAEYDFNVREFVLDNYYDLSLEDGLKKIDENKEYLDKLKQIYSYIDLDKLNNIREKLGEIGWE